jgi:hypothetical protein
VPVPFVWPRVNRSAFGNGDWHLAEYSRSQSPFPKPDRERNDLARRLRAVSFSLWARQRGLAPERSEVPVPISEAKRERNSPASQADPRSRQLSKIGFVPSDVAFVTGHRTQDRDGRLDSSFSIFLRTEASRSHFSGHRSPERRAISVVSLAQIRAPSSDGLEIREYHAESPGGNGDGDQKRDS